MKGMMIAVSGGILASGMGLGTLVLSIFGAVGHMSSLVTGGTCFMAVGALTGVGLLAGGIKKLGKLERFQKYIDTLGNHTYCNFEQLSAAVNKPVKFVKKDIKKMIDDRWFRQGHIDEQETRRRRHLSRRNRKKKNIRLNRRETERTHRLKCRRCWIKEMNFWIRSTGATMRFLERRFLQKYPEWN